MADERDEIRARINIVDLIGRDVQLKKAGKDFKGLCPFHDDKNPSFNVSPTFGTYRCWSCGEHGDIFTYVMKKRNLEFRDALELLAEEAGVSLQNRGPAVPKSERALQRAAMEEALKFFRDQLSKSASARDYLERRGIPQDVIDHWELGYAPDVGDALASHLKKAGFALPECEALFLVAKDSAGGYFDKFRGRLMFAIRDERGDLVAFGGRILSDGMPKYINSSDTPLYRKSRLLYGMLNAKDALGKEKRAVLCEGYLDVIACHRAGVTGAIASLGTALSEEQAKLLKRWCEEVAILYDSDPAGQKAADRAIEVLQAEGLRVRVASMPVGDDPDTLLKREGPAGVQRAVTGAIRPLEHKVKRLFERSKVEDEDFWTEAAEILATATSEMELDKYIVMLAGQYPGVANPVSAQNALRRQVQAARRRLKSGQAPSNEAKRPVAPRNASAASLHAGEMALFRGFVDEPLRKFSWERIQREDLFFTPVGQEMASAIRTAFPDGPPEGPPVAWVHKIEPADLQAVLQEVQGVLRLNGLTTAFLEDSVAKLVRDVQQRLMQQLKAGDLDDTKRSEIYRRIKNLKADK